MRLAAAGALGLLALMAGCGPASQPHTTHLSVFAASSLKASFDKIGVEFEDEHPGVQVDLDFAGSSDLVAQILDGAPADVFASADDRTMAELGAMVDRPRHFAANTLRIAVPPGNPRHITSLADLAKPGVAEVVCAQAVPCGAATQKVARLAHVHLSPVSEEQSVADVLAKVAAGDADAGLVYVTDIEAARGAVDGIDFAQAARVVNGYPIAALSSSPHERLARAFVAFVLSTRGQDILAKAGFAKP